VPQQWIAGMAPKLGDSDNSITAAYSESSCSNVALQLPVAANKNC